ncbi:hypothetical protein AHAS_Ahas02G0028900 [Arachis hypogaea]
MARQNHALNTNGYVWQTLPLPPLLPLLKTLRNQGNAPIFEQKSKFKIYKSLFETSIKTTSNSP